MARWGTIVWRTPCPPAPLPPPSASLRKSRSGPRLSRIWALPAPIRMGRWAAPPPRRRPGPQTPAAPPGTPPSPSRLGKLRSGATPISGATGRDADRLRHARAGRHAGGDDRAGGGAAGAVANPHHEARDRRPLPIWPAGPARDGPGRALTSHPAHPRLPPVSPGEAAAPPPPAPRCRPAAPRRGR